jgi:DNA polymerase-1
MIQCDLSQGEFNAWASYSQDFKMLNDIKNGLDIHRTVASKVWNLKLEDVSKELRTFAKRVVFGLMYGISIDGAAKLVGCSENEAQKIQDTFFNMYPKAAAWLRNIPVVARQQGYLCSVFGRKRRFTHLFNHPLQGIRNYAERLAKNFLMQSTVADITARNMINLKPYLDSKGARIILTVHDSIIVQCNKEDAEEISAEMMRITTQPIPNYHGIIKNDIEVGTSWGNLGKLEFNDDFDIENDEIFDTLMEENDEVEA